MLLLTIRLFLKEEDEDMELVDDEEEIIENEDDEDEDDEDDDDDAIDENENDDDDEDDEDDDDDDDDDEEHDDTSEYYDAYNEMLDFMNDDNDNDTDDILMHLEDLWQNPGHRFVLGQGIGGANSNARAIQIAVSGGTSDATLPPHPLSAPTIHPLLVHHGDSVLNNSNGNITGSHVPAAVAAIGNGLPFGAAAMSSSRLRQQQQHQQQQVRSRISRFIIPGLNLQLTATTSQQPTTTTIPTTAAAALTTITQQANNAAAVPTAAGRPSTALPYNTLNEILQGFETQLPSASYDMFVGGLFNPQMNATHDMLNAFNGTGVGGGGGGGVVGMETGDNGGANLYLIRTPLARWTEECTMLDSHSIHNAVLIVKPRIIELLERYRADELDEKRQKKAQDDEKLKRAKEAAAAAAQSALATTATSTATVNTNVDQQQPVVSDQSESLADHPIEEQVVATIQPPQEVIIQESLIAEQALAPPAATVEVAAAVTNDTVPATNETPSQTNEPGDQDQTQADVAVSQVEATNFLINSLSGSCNIFTLMDNNEKCVAIEALRISDNTRAAHELATMHITDYPQNLVYIDGRVFRLPSGIDPSFLSALPDNLRREVVLEQFRIQGIDTRRPTSVVAADTQPAGTSGTTDQQATGSAQSTAAAILPVGASTAAIQINPEFLAALPPQIQEELIAQQRLEQQQASAAAAAASVNDDDNSAFMRSLPASLRQAILFDMDQSQIGALPDDLASEARGLQQQQQRERDLDLFASHRTNGGFYRAITGTNRFYNAASSLVNDAYFFAGQSRDYNRLRRGLRRLTDAEMHPMFLEKLTRGGRQLLDHESLACLLVLLFVDDTKLNSVKLHRVVRNICIHGPSRAWIIKALLTILEKVSGKPSVECIQPAAIVQERRPVGQGAIAKTSTSAINQATNSTMVTYQPSWLNMSIDGAFGSKTNVFTILRSNSKKAQVKINETNTSVGCY
jgi:hypothetical protein